MLAAISFEQHDRAVLILCSHSTKEMTRPVRPPTLLSAFLAVDPALDKADPPELVTLDRPSDAFDVIFEVASLAFEAVSAAVSFALLAVSAAVEACLTFCRRRRNRDWRSNALEAGAVDMAHCSADGLSCEANGVVGLPLALRTVFAAVRKSLGSSEVALCRTRYNGKARDKKLELPKLGASIC